MRITVTTELATRSSEKSMASYSASTSLNATSTPPTITSMYESMGRHDDERTKFSRDGTPSLPLQAKAARPKLEQLKPTQVADVPDEQIAEKPA